MNRRIAAERWGVERKSVGRPGFSRRSVLDFMMRALAVAPVLASMSVAQSIEHDGSQSASQTNGPGANAHSGNGPPAAPTADELKTLEGQWIDPVRDAAGPTSFHVFQTPSRGAGTQGSYRLYLPPSYAKATHQRYPVLYWLHGGFGNSREGLPAVTRIDRLVQSGQMPETIVVLPHALPVGWYVDSKDGSRPVEQVMTYDLVRHIDVSYRSKPEPKFRWVEGMSMGGYGTLHLALKHPEVFGRCSAVAPAIMHDMSSEPAVRTQNTFFGDEDYFKALSPWTLALANCPQLRKSSRVRVLSGLADTRLVEVLREFAKLLESLGITPDFHEVDKAGHDYEQIVAGLGDAQYSSFWRTP